MGQVAPGSALSLNPVLKPVVFTRKRYAGKPTLSTKKLNKYSEIFYLSDTIGQVVAPGQVRAGILARWRTIMRAAFRQAGLATDTFIPPQIDR